MSWVRLGSLQAATTPYRCRFATKTFNMCRVAMVGTDRAPYHVKSAFVDRGLTCHRLPVKLLQILALLASTYALLRSASTVFAKVSFHFVRFCSTGSLTFTECRIRRPSYLASIISLSIVSGVGVCKHATRVYRDVQL